MCILALIVASGINLPLLAAAATSSASSSAPAAASDSGSSGASAPASAPQLKPHIVLLSLPWRGHMTPLLNLGSRLAARGFHVSMGVATEEARQYVLAQTRASGSDAGNVGGGMVEPFPIGDFESCAKVKRRRERQPKFANMPIENAALHAKLHPGAQLTDLFAAPYFAFQAIDDPVNSTLASAASSAPNGINLLMRTYAEFQACMGATLSTALAELLSPSWSELHFAHDTEAQKAARSRWRQRELDSDAGLSKSAKDKAAREASRKEREAALFPPVMPIAAPKLAIVDRFSFAGMDACLHLDLPYVVNNPHLLLDLDSPSWALPSPWSYLPPQPPLTLMARTANLLHRVNYRASMFRALSSINANRARQGLRALESWDQYFASTLVLTNTLWGIELHRSADAQGMHSHRNANPAANGYTPRFQMTGPLLPVNNGSQHLALYGLPSGPTAAPALGRLPAVTALSVPTFPDTPDGLFSPGLLRFLRRLEDEQQEGGSSILSGGRPQRRVVYINLGDGSELTRRDLDALWAGLRPFQKRLAVVFSLPTSALKSLQPPDGWPGFVYHVSFVPQYQFLARFGTSHLCLVITHGSLANVQESLASGLPVLLLPHPTVDQMEVAGRFARTKAVRVLQRVQVSEENVRESVARMLEDNASGTRTKRSLAMRGMLKFLSVTSSHVCFVCLFASQLFHHRPTSVVSVPVLFVAGHLRCGVAHRARVPRGIRTPAASDASDARPAASDALRNSARCVDALCGGDRGVGVDGKASLDDGQRRVERRQEVAVKRQLNHTSRTLARSIHRVPSISRIQCKFKIVRTRYRSARCRIRNHASRASDQRRRAVNRAHTVPRS